MRDLIVHASLEHPGAAWGGIGSAVSLLLRAGEAEGVPSALLHPTSAPEDRRWVDRRVVVDAISGPGDVYRSPRRIELGNEIAHQAFAELLRLTAEGYSPLVVIHNEELHRLAGICRQHRIPVVYYLHGLARQEHPDRPALHQLQDQILSAGVVTCVATEAQRTVVEQLQGTSSHVVPLPLLLLAAPDRDSSTRDPSFIVSAGRLVPQKGFDLLLRALSLVRDPYHCLIYCGHGDADYESLCKELAGGMPSVRLVDWVDRETLLAAIRRAGLMVMPSRFEPLGLLAAESVGLGTPVVASDVGGLGELMFHAKQALIPMQDGAPNVVALGALLQMHLESPSAPPDPELAFRDYTSAKTIDCLLRAFERV